MASNFCSSYYHLYNVATEYFARNIVEINWIKDFFKNDVNAV